MTERPLRAAYLRMEDGKPALVIIREGAVAEVLPVRPDQLLAFAKDAACLMWGRYDLTERK